MPLTNIEIETMILVKAACRKYTEEKNSAAPIDWEQRRYEIARDCMASQMASINHGQYDYKSCASNAVAYADALIAELKK